MKAIWKGSISFGLVNVPVKLISAVRSQSLSFHMLHKKDHSRIKFKRFCEEEQKEVPWDEIERGLEIKKGQYAIISAEEIKKARPQKTETIDVRQFVDSSRIDPVYYDAHYYLVPEKSGMKAFFLLREAMMTAAKTAICTFVMKEKEHVCAITAYKEGLLLSTLNYQHEIRDIGEIDELAKVPKLTKDETELAMQLIGKLKKNTFDISSFKDEFSEEIRKLLTTKGKLEPIAEAPKKKAKPLIEALKASLK